MRRWYGHRRLVPWLLGAGLLLPATGLALRAAEPSSFSQKLGRIFHLRRSKGQEHATPVQAPQALQKDGESPIAQTSAVAPANAPAGSRFPRVTTSEVQASQFAAQATLLTGEEYPIDLATAFQLASVQNQQVLIAQQISLAATARQQFQAAQMLPTLNIGTNYDSHTGLVQQSSGNMLNINRSAVYVGGGADAVAAGSVNIPGLVYNMNVAETQFRFLASRQLTNASRFASQAVSNNVMLGVAQAYGEVILAEGMRSNAILTRNEAREVARLTADHARIGQGRQSDADRAATELARRENEVLINEADVLQASARLAALLSLESSVRLQPTDVWVVPRPIVPELIPLNELLAIALVQRPELNDHRSQVAAALLDLHSAKLLPFSPNIILGYSAGGFGGGSNVIEEQGKPRFSSLDARADLDIIAWWSLKNCGVGNHALVQAAKARWRQSDLEMLAVLNRVRQEVADAYVRTHTRFAEIDLREQAVRSSQEAFDGDMLRIRNAEGRPIEVLDSLRLLREARNAYLQTIVEYNAAHYELYARLGEPPANMLIRPAGEN